MFVATKETQGERKSDFCFVACGELLRFATECDGERIDGPCGCRRSLVGIQCHKATTTFVVQEAPISEQEFAEKLSSSYAEAGFGNFLTSDDAREEAMQLMQLASSFPTGCVVEKRGNKFVSRTR